MLLYTGWTVLKKGIAVNAYITGMSQWPFKETITRKFGTTFITSHLMTKMYTQTKMPPKIERRIHIHEHFVS